MLTIFKIASYMLGHLPMPVVRALALIIGRMAYRLDKRHREVAIENLRRAYKGALSQDETEQTAKRVFNNLALNFFEFTRIPWLDEQKLNRLVKFEDEDLDRLRNALSRNRGAIILTAHFGNWELLAATLSMHGFEMDLVARELDNPTAEEFVKWVRTSHGNRVVNKTRAMRRLLKTLSQNGVVLILLDQNAALSEGVFVDFFGMPACTNKGLALFASSSRAAVLPTFLIREGYGHRLVIGDEVPIVDTGDREKDVLTNTARFTAEIEKAIRERPQEWFWVHRRWKSRKV